LNGFECYHRIILLVGSDRQIVYSHPESFQ
jgi:hypothetical protein